jgi:hypothetical protein
VKLRNESRRTTAYASRESGAGVVATPRDYWRS